jgi:hypothetical protein
MSWIVGALAVVLALFLDPPSSSILEASRLDMPSKKLFKKVRPHSTTVNTHRNEGNALTTSMILKTKKKQNLRPQQFNNNKNGNDVSKKLVN